MGGKSEIEGRYPRPALIAPHEFREPPTIKHKHLYFVALFNTSIDQAFATYDPFINSFMSLPFWFLPQDQLQQGCFIRIHPTVTSNHLDTSITFSSLSE
jgi:hypothetical protein